ncbi:MobF family relaxase [Pengzhenrongella frigida]|uniref:Transfer protein Tra n=1 Tax=Pengzhenrongella frigida TaxID=1259133 RepID=A0A4Q5N308_9MICO|nr:MobF family relaxase [Cellulomonas sp. HLT2-17]RYV50987.1 transfer protein Tra [Cellulomonas sp. HLT2-17]
MSIHKLTAGSGYDYLTRQVAVHDATEKGHTSLASYYAARGEAPGTWIGSGLVGIDGLDEGDEVTAEQLRNLFGAGKHPLAEQLRAAAAETGLSEREQETATWLGTPFRVYANDTSAFRIRVAKEIAALNASNGRRSADPVPLADRARIRTQVAAELFREEHGREPADARELAATIAKHSRPRTNAVAGYDLTFSPVKSVSTLWAIADRPIAAAIERAHQTAVKDALAFLENTALFTREGTNGVRQVESRGLVATAFTHRDSRAGDPDLHTHVAVANKVQTRDMGRWLAIDGRLIFAATVAASETYNTALERHLTDTLGLRFEVRPGDDPRKRPVREIVGVDPALASRWSTRRASIEVRRAELASTFQATHGRPPTPVESVQLAQQATLETRQGKPEPRSLAEQRATWAAQARGVLGGERGVQAMLRRVLRPAEAPTRRVDAAWVRETAAVIQNTLQANRSYWQRWHVEAEAQRRVRGVAVRTRDVERVVGLLVDEVLTRRSVPLTRSERDIETPTELRRSDGSSVYTIAGSTLFTSPDLLAAEARIVAHAGQHDGTRATAAAVGQALTQSAADGLPLNAGQASLVTEMATSGARVQLAIAPAGAGKTTAMRALATAWTAGGGDVVGLAPSATAATVLGEAIAARTDTMAKLLWHLDHDPEHLPGWARRIGPASLVVVDEAGMADTLSLDRLIEFVTARGGSVRLVGDDQQLSAVGAGGVLRDVRATHGALHLTELMRFADPAEGAASLALRDGLTESLGFYLDAHRIHVGDLTTLTDDVFDAWRTDREAGRDAVMLAPTRELVGELNDRARAHRLAGQTPERTVSLADGSTASAGDTVITRANNRQLRVTGTDWVKNGDRWHVTAVHSTGALTVRHTTSGCSVDLPADYVRTAVGLGYATTIHTAQGVTADTSHTLLTGQESRQLTYTAVTRGKAANHLYLEVVGDGDEHNVIRPDYVQPLTATDLLERILARDESAKSAHTTRRVADDPTTLLSQAAARYVDSLYVGAEQLLGPQQVERLDRAADLVVPELTRAAAWPTLRAHLLLLAAQEGDPVAHLRAAADARELDTADDVAAVLDWRLDDTGLRNAGTGPLPWLPSIPAALGEDPQWGPYLAARAAQVRDLGQQVTEQAQSGDSMPQWARTGQHRPDDDLLVQVSVWRAATGVPDSDRRPTGAPHLGKAAARYQQTLDTRLATQHTPALAEWQPLLDRALTDDRHDAFMPVLAERLSALARAGLNAPQIVRSALADGGLPDDHAAAALWWRITGRLSPAVAAQAESDQHLTTAWTPRLADLVGPDTADMLQASPWWPALVTSVDHAIARGNTLECLFAAPIVDDDVDPCQALVWRISVLTDPVGESSERYRQGFTLGGDEVDPFGQDDPQHGLVALTDNEWQHLLPAVDQTQDDRFAPEPDEPDTTDPFDDPAFVEAFLTLAAAARAHATTLPPTDRMVDAQAAREFDAAMAPVSPARILELNRLATDFYVRQFPDSWAQRYLTERLRTDLTGDPYVLPGYAPAGWTRLVDHLHRQGVTDLELTESGLASVARTGRLIDRFRDRLVFPITRLAADGELEPLGFVGRRHPEATDQTGGPKYLNTPNSVLFHKGAQLYTVRADRLESGAAPVLVEGPVDAVAVALAGGSRFVGVAPLGTSLTNEQARELAALVHRNGASTLVATDADLAGRLAAERDYWLLAQHGLAPAATLLPAGWDPASLLEGSGAANLRAALRSTTDLAEILITENLGSATGLEAVRGSAQVLASTPPYAWGPGTSRIALHTRIPEHVVRRELARALQQWTKNPGGHAAERLAEPSTERRRMGPSTHPAPLPKTPRIVEASRPSADPTSPSR